MEPIMVTTEADLNKEIGTQVTQMETSNCEHIPLSHVILPSQMRTKDLCTEVGNIESELSQMQESSGLWASKQQNSQMKLVSCDSVKEPNGSKLGSMSKWKRRARNKKSGV